MACDVSNETNDKQQFEPMLQKAQKNVGQDKRIKAASADSSYYSESNVRYAEAKKIDAYIATKKIKHNDPVMKAPRGRPPKNLTVKVFEVVSVNNVDEADRYMVLGIERFK